MTTMDIIRRTKAAWRSIHTMTAEDKSLILLEELDKGVHPSRAKDMVKMLREIGKQKQLDIICTTHNATFIDELGPQMIPFISYIMMVAPTFVCLKTTRSWLV